MSVTTGFADLDVLLDPTRLHELLGRDDLTVTRVRHKPGQYAVAALADTEGPTAWARVTGDLARAQRDVDRGARVGRTVSTHPAGGGLVVTTGDLWSDPKLADPLARVADVVDASVPVRHNPLRRLVLRRGSTQLRLTAGPQQPVESWAPALVDPAVGLTAGLRGRVGRHLSRWEWVEGETLEARLGHGAASDLAAGELLGSLLARVHMTPLDPVPSSPAPRVQMVDRAALRRSAHDLRSLDAELGASMLAVVDSLPTLTDPGEVVLHGDYSADQVVVSPTGPRVIDLDRAAVGPAARDLVSALAHDALRTGSVEGPFADGLRRGYLAGGRPWPQAGTLVPAQAAALLSRAQEPLRAACPDWRRRARSVVELAAEVLR